MNQGTAAVFLLGLWVACSDPRPSAPSFEPPTQRTTVSTTPSPVVTPRAAATSTTPAPPPARTQPTTIDGDYATDAPVTVRRMVYRVTLGALHGLGSAGTVSQGATRPPAELFIDVSSDRLRARFAGPWPVASGSEVRIRREQPGAYVFDGQGGRALMGGRLAAWFQGESGSLSNRRSAVISMSFSPTETPTAQGDMLCALLAEWTGADRESAMGRCARRAPSRFVVGPWRAERTADLPVELPRSGMRADHEGGPTGVIGSSSRAFLDPNELGHIEPRRLRGTNDPEPAEPSEGLSVDNQSRARVVVMVGGSLIGWVDAGTAGHFVGLRPGYHWVSAMRPLGRVVVDPRLVPVPSELVVR